MMIVKMVVPILLVSLLLWTGEGFAPPKPISLLRTRSSSSNGVGGGCSQFGTFLGMSITDKKKDKMTSQDEEILFGESPTEPNPPYPARHRHISRTGNVLPSTNLPINPLDHSPNDPLINALRKTRETIHYCPQIWSELTKLCPDKPAIVDDHLCDTKIKYTFQEMDTVVKKSAAIFRDFGVERGVNIAVLGENSAMWLVIDHGIQLAGGASAVRGADAPADELRYIYEHSDSKNVVVLQGPRLLKKLAEDAKKQSLKGLGLRNEKYGDVQRVILMHREKQTDDEIASMAESLGVEIRVFADLLQSTTEESLAEYDIPTIQTNDLSTIVYTSGTTGRPKGVMLTHGNLLHQISHRIAPTKPYDETEPLPGETMLALLPVWHITERTFELWMITRGCNVVYSSIRTFKNDLANYKPHWMVLVPRVLEKVAAGVQTKFATSGTAVQTLAKTFTSIGTLQTTHSKIARGLVVSDSPPTLGEKTKSRILDALFLKPLHALGTKLVWSKVRDGFGGRLKLIISGGSALAGSLESFYEIAGIPIIVGYGLTECAPLVAHRRGDANLITPGCVGMPTLDTELRVVDPDAKPSSTEERKAVKKGDIGVVLARGPQVMQGYYKNPEATSKAIDEFGWFDTGDLGRVNPATGDVILTGRCKDTIVLSNGENIEPSPIEDSILSTSNLIEQVMLTGQDGRSLVAVLVLSPAELENGGFLKNGSKLQKENEKVNDPKCSEEDCEAGEKVLEEASMSLRENEELRSALQADIRRATADFRKWEQVGDFYITLVPFAMANGLLTQSYKVKRDSVMKRYGDVL